MYKKILIITLALAVLVVSRALVTMYITNKNGEEIKYEVLFNGFIPLDSSVEPIPRSSEIVFTSAEQWEDYCNKYFPDKKFIVNSYMYIDGGTRIDFSKENIIFYSREISSRTFYSVASFIDKIYVKDNTLRFTYNDYRTLYGLHVEGAQNVFLFIARVNKDDIPTDLKNIYQEDKDYSLYQIKK